MSVFTGSVQTSGFFIGRKGELLEISASRKGVKREGMAGAACSERSEEVQYLSIFAPFVSLRKKMSRTKPLQVTRKVD